MRLYSASFSDFVMIFQNNFMVYIYILLFITIIIIIIIIIIITVYCQLYKYCTQCEYVEPYNWGYLLGSRHNKSK